jgi:hypothetical protein
MMYMPRDFLLRKGRKGNDYGDTKGFSYLKVEKGRNHW